MLYIKKLNKISNQIKALSQSTNLVVVTKNQDQNIIKKLAETNHINFGENRVQEAINKWSNVINLNSNIKSIYKKNPIKIFSNKFDKNNYIEFSGNKVDVVIKLLNEELQCGLENIKLHGKI